ncbi:GNAT family N-acetyltransferase [Sulfitobacter albidus]|uniref:L-ornithine N(alpha)-acyltransferase n=1 Tax=Sulfitobacter albidus TaxID=2829501 RepID=A0A975JGP4_9RHOB|nr:GNAT family N-acetyltransferase [Sulfitobacter albidus]
MQLAQSAADLRAAQRLRYEVFVRELGAQADGTDHSDGLERDRFDTVADHLIARPAGSDDVVGVYRLLRREGAAEVGGFYSEGEYDLAPLLSGGKRLLELGRSCLHPDHRGGTALHHLWAALVAYTRAHEIEVLFGTASFRGTDPATIAAPLSLLQYRHLAPEPLRPRALATGFQRMDLIADAQLDRRAAMVEMPSLIKSYLRLGGYVGEGAFVDHRFNTTDVCLVLETASVDPARLRRLTQRQT